MHFGDIGNDSQLPAETEMVTNKRVTVRELWEISFRDNLAFFLLTNSFMNKPRLMTRAFTKMIEHNIRTIYIKEINYLSLL